MPIIKYNVNEVYISSSNFLANASLKIENNYLKKKWENGEQISKKKKRKKRVVPLQKWEGLNCGNGRKPTREWNRTTKPPPLKPSILPS